MRSSHAVAERIAARPAAGTVVGDLQDRRRGWQVVDGEWHPRSLTKAINCHGLAMAYVGAFVAVYVANDRVWLQVGAHVWDAATIQRVVQTEEWADEVVYTLELRDGTSARVDLRLSPDVVACRLKDPTYDEMDSWADDVMKVFPYVAADGWSASDTTDLRDWARRVQRVWKSGFKHGR